MCGPGPGNGPEPEPRSVLVVVRVPKLEYGPVSRPVLGSLSLG